MKSYHRVHTEPGKCAILTKSPGKSGIVMEFSIIFIQVGEKSGKTNYLVHISLSLTICMVVSKVVAPFVVSKCEFYNFALCESKYM